MRADQAGLQLGAAVGVDELGGQGTEAGGDSVVRLWVAGQAVDEGAACGHLVEGSWSEFDAGAVPSNGDDIVDGDRANSDGNRLHRKMLSPACGGRDRLSACCV